MLEILALIVLTNKIGKMVEQKGYESGKYKLLTCVLWISGEIFGSIIGAIITGGNILPTYIIAIMGAAIGAITSYLIAESRPERILPQSVPGIAITEEVKKDVTLEIHWKGAFVILDSDVSILLDNVLIGSGSFVKGFTLQVLTTEGVHKLDLKFPAKITSTTVNVEKGRNYRVDIQYSRAWGKAKITYSEIAKI